VKGQQRDIDVLALTLYLCSVGAGLVTAAVIVVVQIATGGEL
jgi:hypothetical protein